MVRFIADQLLKYGEVRRAGLGSHLMNRLLRCNGNPVVICATIADQKNIRSK
jgi:hypothetical protein